LNGVAVEKKAIGCRTSTGDAPQLLQTPDLGSLSTTTVLHSHVKATLQTMKWQRHTLASVKLVGGVGGDLVADVVWCFGEV